MTTQEPGPTTDPHGQPPVPSTEQAPVAPVYDLAEWGPRAGAFIIDRLITYVFVGLFAAASTLAFFQADVGGVIIGIVLAVIGLLLWAFYAPILVSRPGAKNGQTWGKQMLGIRAVRNNGKPFDFGQGLLRELICKGILPNVAGSVILLIPTILNFLWPLWDDEKRAVHDMLASSHVVDDRD